MGWLIDLAKVAIPGAGATSKSLEGAPDPLPPLSRAAEARRRKVLALLARDGGQYAVLVEDPNPDPIILSLATPDGTCEVLIPKDRYDPFKVMDTLKGWSARPPPSGGAWPSPSPAARPSRSIPPRAAPSPTGKPTPSATTAMGAP
jgi:hypothetical protein